MPYIIPLPFGRHAQPDSGAPDDPALAQVLAAIASILGSLRGSNYLPESGLHWAAGMLIAPDTAELVVATSFAGWLPPGVLIPAGVKVLWNVPATAWATVDDPVQQIVDYARSNDDFAIAAVCTTHPSRASAPAVAPTEIAPAHSVGPVLDGGLNRFETVASPARIERVQSMTPDEATRQVHALLRDLERISPTNAVTIPQARVDARRYLAVGSVPAVITDQLRRDDDKIYDTLQNGRLDPHHVDLSAAAPATPQFHDRMIEFAALDALRAAIHSNLEDAVYAWTFARYLDSARSLT